MAQDREQPPMAQFDVGVDGSRIVTHAPDVIHIKVKDASRMLRAFGATSDIEELEDGGIVLDSAGEYRYRLVDRDRWDKNIGIYERI